MQLYKHVTLQLYNHVTLQHCNHVTMQLSQITRFLPIDASINGRLWAVHSSNVQSPAVVCNNVQCSAVQYSAIQSVPYSTVQCSAVKRSAVQCDTIEYAPDNAEISWDCGERGAGVEP